MLVLKVKFSLEDAKLEDLGNQALVEFFQFLLFFLGLLLVISKIPEYSNLLLLDFLTLLPFDFLHNSSLDYRFLNFSVMSVLFILFTCYFFLLLSLV